MRLDVHFEGCPLNIILIKTQTTLTKQLFLFQQILEAYECLIDEGKRRLYDAQLEAAKSRAWWGWY